MNRNQRQQDEIGKLVRLDDGRPERAHASVRLGVHRVGRVRTDESGIMRLCRNPFAHRAAKRPHVNVGTREHDAGSALHDQQQHQQRHEYPRERIVSEIERRMASERALHEFREATAEHRPAGQERPPTRERAPDERPDEAPHQVENERVAHVHVNCLQRDDARIIRNAEPPRVQNDSSDRRERQDGEEVYPMEDTLRSIPDAIFGQCHCVALRTLRLIATSRRAFWMEHNAPFRVSRS